MMTGIRHHWLTRLIVASLGIMACSARAQAADMAVSLDGVNDYLTAPGTAALQPAGQVAVEAWVKMTATDISGAEIISMGDDYALRVQTGGLLYFFIDTNGGTTFRSHSASSGNVKDGAWHHVVGQKTAGALEIYVDGTLRGGTAYTGSIGYRSGGALYLGRHGRSSSSYDFKGAIDEARVYNRALSAAEVAAHYNAGAGKYGGAESGLVGGWHLDEGSGTTAADYSGGGNTLTLKNGVAWVAGKVSAGGGADTTPPAISAVGASNITSTGAKATWTTNEAATSQVEYGLTTAYGQSTMLDSTLVTSHSVTLSGLSASTLYHYRVKSKDAAGNQATSADATFTTIAPPDATAPTVALTAPSAGMVGGSAVTISANASDNIAVAGVQFKLDGTNLGAEDTTAPYAFTWDTRTATEAAHALTAVARDAAGNTTASAAVTVTVDNTPPALTIMTPVDGQVIIAPEP